MPPQTIDLARYNAVYQEQWNKNPGVPVAVYGEAGPLYLACKKYMRDDLAGREDHRTPIATTLPGAGAATVARAVQNASGMGTDLFQVKTFNTLYQTLQLDWGIAKRRGELTYVGDHMGWQMMGHAKRVEHLSSAYVYGNGGGALARIDPNSTINIGDTVIQLLLPRTAIQFESARRDTETNELIGGDLVEFSVDKGGPSGGAGVRGSYAPRIVGAKNVAGQLELETGIPEDPLNPGNPLVQPGDYVFAAGTYSQVMRGLAAWNPANSAELAGLFYGVDRSKVPERLGGLRIKIPLGQDPRTKWARICKVAQENGSRFDAVYTTPEEYEQISNAVATGALRGVQYMPDGYKAEMGPGRPRARRTKDNGVMLYIDLPGMMVENPSTGRMVKVIPDQYFYDVEAGPEGQGIYRGLDHNRFYMETVKSYSYWWVNYDGNGPVYQIQGSSIITATYEVYGQYICEDPLSLLYAGPNAVA